MRAQASSAVKMPPTPTSGIAPPVAIRQKNTTRNPRSTVATGTELYDFLRVLWARAGRTYCPNCKTQVVRDTVDQVAAKLSQLPIASRWYALFPLPPEKKKDLSDELRDRQIGRAHV